MKTREITPDQLGLKEDWEGNNIALECPVCAKVFIVSEQIHGGERACPICGKSRGAVTGGKKSGGKASISWEESARFSLGQFYSRADINAVLGGSEVDYLPTVDGRVVCGCFTLDHNPEAPEVVIPGTGKIIQRQAELFCNQSNAVPVFIKRRANQWEYVGDFKAVRYSTDPVAVAAHHKGSITPLQEVTRVIFLQRQ